ncbi:MAG TPA: pyridoxal phosphate-dependent aminotransferase, partial [Chroococcales cyanobacterium]
RRWAIDLDHLQSQISARSRAIVIISPHNPTGMVIDNQSMEELAEIAGQHNLAIISDEVFSQFVFSGESYARPHGTCAPLVLTLNGLSKMFALPAIKLSWIAVSGEAELVRKAMAVLEMISDTFLPVNETAQFAVPEIIAQGRDFLNSYRATMEARVTAAWRALAELVPKRPQAGFYLTVPLAQAGKELKDEHQMALKLLEEDRLLTHPGYFYDMDGNHLVIACVAPENVLAAAGKRIRDACLS